MRVNYASVRKENHNEASLSKTLMTSHYWTVNLRGVQGKLVYDPAFFMHFRWKGIVVVGGDGSFYEVLNGIFARPDWRDVFKQVPLGIIPSGSGNGLARYVWTMDSLSFHR